MKFNNYQEMYDLLQQCHGGKINDEGLNHVETVNMFSKMGSENTFGKWLYDDFMYDDVACTEYRHWNEVDGKTRVFIFYEDGSDTINDDEVIEPRKKVTESVAYDLVDDLASDFNIDLINK